MTMSSYLPLRAERAAEGSPLGRELVALGRLALPLVLANLGQVLIGFVDTAVLGRLSPAALAAGGLGSSIFFCLAALGTGLLLGLDPLLSQAFGAGEHRQRRAWWWQGVWLALAVSLPLAVVGAGAGLVLERLGIGSEVAGLTRDYLWPRLVSLAPCLVFVVARSSLQATGAVLPVLAAAVLANLTNLPLSLALAFGGLGVAGTAWASTVSTLVQLLAVLWAIGGRERSLLVPAPPCLRLLRRVAALGVPLCLATLAEYGIFLFVHLAVGRLDPAALPSHQVALAFSGATFVIPLGIGAAAAVRVGYAVGRRDWAGVRLAGLAGLTLGGGVMICAATLLWVAPLRLARVLTSDSDVVLAAVPLLFVAAVFQLSDGVQAVAAGALRGAGDTRSPLIANLLGHYVVGLPLGLWLAVGVGIGARGLWWGLSVGLLLVAVALTRRFWVLTRGTVRSV